MCDEICAWPYDLTQLANDLLLIMDSVGILDKIEHSKEALDAWDRLCKIANAK